MKTFYKILAFKIEAYDYFLFKEDLKNNFKDYLLIKFNPHSITKVVIDTKNKSNRAGFYFSSNYIRNRMIYYIFYPIIFIIDFIKIFFYLKSVCSKKEFEYFFTDNTYTCVAFILLSFNKKVKIIYASHDWLAGTSGKGIWSKIGKNVIFVFFDYIECRFSYLVLNHTEILQKKRNEYWKHNIFNQKIYYPNIKLNKKDTNLNNKKKRNIIFLGLVRDESGLPDVIKVISKYDSKIKLKIVGTINKKTNILIKNNKLEKIVNIAGFQERKNFESFFQDCFCGLCLVVNDSSYTNNTIPSKIIDYLQYGIPIIATSNLGYTSNLIKENKIGIIIDKDLKDLEYAINNLYKNFQTYNNSIKMFFNGYNKTDIKEIFK